MGQCRYCGRSGWLLTVDSVGLCAHCRPAYTLAVSERTRVIEESQSLVLASAKLDTRLSRCDVIMDQARGLLDYEQHGVSTIEPPPLELIRSMTALKDRLILEAMQAAVLDAQRKADVAQGAKAKTTALRKTLLTVREYAAKTSSPEVLSTIEQDLELRLRQIQLNGYLDEAQKAEFKGNKKKALDQYYEALYFLKHDKAADAQVHTSKIEAKIIELGGTVPT